MGQEGHKAAGAENLHNVASTFFNTVHSLPKDLRFEHGDAKLGFLTRAPSDVGTPLHDTSSRETQPITVRIPYHVLQTLT